MDRLIHARVLTKATVWLPRASSKVFHFVRISLPRRVKCQDHLACSNTLLRWLHRSVPLSLGQGKLLFSREAHVGRHWDSVKPIKRRFVLQRRYCSQRVREQVQIQRHASLSRGVHVPALNFWLACWVWYARYDGYECLRGWLEMYAGFLFLSEWNTDSPAVKAEACHVDWNRASHRCETCVFSRESRIFCAHVCCVSLKFITLACCSFFCLFVTFFVEQKKF